MSILKQSTAATIKLGVFVDDTDGKTAETALTIGQADIRLSKNGGDIAQTHNTAGATHDELGYYDIPLDTTDTGTLGRLRVLVSKAGALPVWQDFVVVTANVFDTFCSTGSLNVNVASLSTDAINAASVKADAVTKIQNGLATSAALDAVDNFVDTEVAAILAAVDTEVAAIKAKTDNLPASPAAVGSAMTLTAAYDKAKDDVLTPLATVDGVVDAIKVQTDKIPATPASSGEYTTNIGAIKAKTDNLPLSPASSGEYTSALTAIQNDLDNPNQYKADVSNLALQATSLAIKGQTDKIPAAPAQTGEYNAALTAIQADLDNPDQYKADVSGLATTAHVQEVENKIDAIDVTVNTIPTNPLLDTAYTAPDNAGIAAIQEKTEQLTFTAPNKVDASATVDPTGIATSEELDIIGEKVDGVLNKLNVSSVEFVTAVVGSNITILRGDTLAARLLDLGDLTQYASLDFTVKRVAGELDDAAKIRLRKNASGTDDGLLRINGAEYATATDGSIVIDDLTTGDIEIRLNANATSELVPGNYVYDVQLITSNNVRTLTAGKLEVVADVTRAVA